MADAAHLALLAEGTFSWNTWRRDHPQIQPDLRGANLSEAELTGADLEGTDLEGLGVDLHDADLQGVNLSRAHLRANLIRANLRGADLSGAVLHADLRGADLREAVLDDVDLKQVSLSGANLSGADLRGRDLSGMDLNTADLRGADLSGINLREATLSRADLRDARLTGANLTRANLSEVDVSGMDLKGTLLIKATLTQANLSRADLSETNLSEAELFQTDLRTANLRSAYLRRADLAEANLSDADLSGANLSRTNLFRTNFSRANLSGAFLKGAFLRETNFTEADLTETAPAGPSGKGIIVEPLCHVVSSQQKGYPMSSEEDKAIPRRNPKVIGYALLLSLGLYFLVLGGGAIYLLAPLLLPPTIVQNDNPFFAIGIQALVFVFLGGLMVPGGLIGLKAIHWLVAIGMLLLSLLAAFGPELLLPPQDIPVSPITTFGGVMVLLSLVLLSRLKRVWPVLWRTLLVASAGAAIDIVVLFWPSPPGVYASQYLNTAMVVIILIVGYWFASQASLPELES